MGNFARNGQMFGRADLEKGKIPDGTDFILLLG